MKIENLEAGMVVKNYRDLCELLEIDYSSGNTKIKQVCELQRFVKYDVEGHKIIIEEIYETPLEKTRIHGGSRNNTKYKVPLEKQILTLLQKTEDYQICFPKYVLCEELELVSPNYRRYNYHYEPLVKELGVTMFEAEDFYESTNSSLTYTIVSTLERLVNKKSISYQKVIIGKFSDDMECYEIVDKELIKKILEIENKALEKMECKTIGEVIYKNMYQDYNLEVNEQLKKEMSIDYIFEAYKITSTELIVSHQLETEYKNVSTDFINKDFLSRTIVNIGKRHKRADIPTIGNQPHHNTKIRYRGLKQYKENQTKIANRTIQR